VRLLGLDFETSWTQPVNTAVARITEVGAVLMNWEDKSPLVLMSELILDDGIPASPPELVELTGITDAMMLEFGKPKEQVLKQLCDLIDKADYVVAHNGTVFDKPILQAELERLQWKFPETPWIDTKLDVPYPKRVKSTSLSNLAQYHEFLNPFAHRALSDVQTMLKVLADYDLQTVIDLSKEETVTVVASVSFSEKELAKARGYYWNADDKSWCKDMKVSKTEVERAQAPFATQIRRKVW